MKIGIFDSGIGGISVLHEALKLLPDEQYIFYADSDHAPYGTKTPEEVRSYCDEIVEKLIKMGTDAVLIACNTATAVAADYLREKYDIPIIAMEPAVKPAVKHTEEVPGRVLVMATPITIRENKLAKLLETVDTNHVVDLLAMPKLVEFAEKQKFDTEEVYDYIRSQIADLDTKAYSDVVLGCTHFNYFKPAISEIFNEGRGEAPGVEMIDGNLGTVKHLAKKLGLEIKTENEMDDKTTGETAGGASGNIMNFGRGKVEYYISGRIVKDAETLGRFKRLHRRLEMVRSL